MENIEFPKKKKRIKRLVIVILLVILIIGYNIFPVLVRDIHPFAYWFDRSGALWVFWPITVYLNYNSDKDYSGKPGDIECLYEDGQTLGYRRYIDGKAYSKIPSDTRDYHVKLDLWGSEFSGIYYDYMVEDYASEIVFKIFSAEDAQVCELLGRVPDFVTINYDGEIKRVVVHNSYSKEEARVVAQSIAEYILGDKIEEYIYDEYYDDGVTFKYSYSKKLGNVELEDYLEFEYTCDRTTNKNSFVVEMDSDHRENPPEMDVDALWNYVCERFTAACDSYYDEVLGAEERSKMTYSEPLFLKLHTDPNGKMYVTGYIYARDAGDLKLDLSVCISHRYRLYLPEDL